MADSIPIRRRTVGELLIAALLADILAVGLPMVALIQPGRVDVQYSSWVFFGMPIGMGLICALVLEHKEWAYFFDVVYAGLLGMALVGLVLMVFAAEGIICLIMAAPIAALGIFIGAGLGRLITGRRLRKRNGLLCSVPVVLLTGVALEARTVPIPTYRTMSSEIRVNAPPDAIWPYIGRLDRLPEPSEPLFRAGIAHPVRVVMDESPGVGASRTCELSTGPMPEVITAWEPNRRLGFRVLSTPPSMHELNPFGAPHPPHLTGMYESVEGRFDLIGHSDGTTTVVGSSLYLHRYSPRLYWNLWTDEIVREVQMRVLREVKSRAEAGR